MNPDLQVSASSCEKIIWAWYAYFSGSPIHPRPGETPEELKDRVKDAIEGTVYSSYSLIVTFSRGTDIQAK